ncbi:hypothetical protein M8998_01075 [Sphingobacterium sp. lm-10]|uniref:DUF7009 family protein n=1 Tax=Sphingobacterium sp. lm-10 TaxID=2944904 RepID=UPI002020F5B9|nr:hypothetical protein [Sphingobacterium sp. lm-10]MCL7986522.1 hypothetical protein [Sphingobacterium sp. lm-10]
MKIRIKDNSVRLRLTQSEVTDLGSKGRVSGFTEFIDQPFVYSIETSAVTTLSATFVANKIILFMPATMVHEFVTTDRVGFEGQVGLVKLLVEKDFACIDNTVEDQSDNFPNPNVKC